MATKPIRSTADVPGLVDALAGKQATLTAPGDVPGLTDALAAKLPLAGGTLTGQVAAEQALGVTTPRIALTNKADTTLYAQACLWISNTARGIGAYIANASTGYGLSVVNSGGGRGISAENTSTGSGVYSQTRTSSGNAAYLVTATTATGRALFVSHLATSTSAIGALLQDASDGSTGGFLFACDHYSTGDAAYAFDVKNWPGATSAFVIHQYSEKSGKSALRIDNCGSGSSIEVWNTENATSAPGQFGSGRFLNLRRRPATGEAVEDCWYVSGEGVLCAVPKAAEPATLADGMVWVHGTGADMHVYARLNGVTKELAVVS